MAKRGNPGWLKQAVFYEVYPQSFHDSNADGIGDLKGLCSKLDYIRNLGCDAIWLNPCFVSPFQDAGYDVADFYKIAPRYGTNADAKRLFSEARKRGMRVCLDLVAGHTSMEHPWFKQSAQAKPNRYSDWFVWTDRVWSPPGPGMESVRGFSERDGAYVTNFFYSQPALNYGFAKPDPKRPWQMKSSAKGPRQVVDEMLKVMRFWLRMGASGFRVDMAGSLVKQDPNQKATIALWQKLSARIKGEFPDSVLISEWGMPQRAIEAGFDIDFMLHFPTPGYSSLFRHGKDSFFSAHGNKGAGTFLKEYLSNLRATQGRGYISVPSGNHDMDRLALGRSQDDLRVCFAFLLTLPGLPFIYYGDEIGMDKVMGLASKEGGYDRTGSRTPMQWSSARNKGFSKADPKRLYLPVDSRPGAPDAQRQLGDGNSLLSLVRELIVLRHSEPSLQSDASLRVLHDGRGGGPLAYLRGEGREKILVVLQPKLEGRPWQARLGAVGLETLAQWGLSAQLRGGRFQAQGRGFGIYRVVSR
jgi:glycosidase